MSAVIIPLGAVRAAINDARADADRQAHAIANDVVGVAIAAAYRAYSASGSVFQADPELARIINRAVARTMRATIRNILAPVTTPDVRANLVSLASEAYFERLHRLTVAGEGGQAVG